MGIDCPDVRCVIRWGPPSDVKQYLQETGRAGRDGLPSKAILHYANVKGFALDISMKEYCTNTSLCRHQVLMSHFGPYADSDSTHTLCICCDICAMKCKCLPCS